MSLESILQRITNNADAESQKIIQQARREAEVIIQQAQKEADKMYEGLLAKEKILYEAQKQKFIVNARLEYKKDLLSAKQGLINGVLEKVKHRLGKDKLKKEQIAQDKIYEVSEDIDFFLGQLLRDCETEIAKVLFSEK
jgi:vacuolar-type H+-ATPase subunit E/Vma4